MPREPPVTRTVRGSLCGSGHSAPHRITALADVMPAPKPTSRMRSPSCTRPCSIASTRAQGDRRRRRVAGAVEHRRNPLHRDAEPCRRGLDDAEVRLMGHDEREVVDRDAGLRERLRCRVDHHAHRAAEDLAPVHLHVAADIRVQQRLRGAVGAEVPAEQLPGAFDGFEHDRTGTVSEQDRGAPVLPVDDPRQRLGTDDQDLVGARTDEAVRGDEGVDEARAGGVEVERTALQPELVLHGRCGRGHGLVGRRGGEHQQVDLASRRCPRSRARHGPLRPRGRRSCRRRGAP